MILSVGAVPAVQAQSQATEDVVYLKDGSVIHGTIIEQRPGISILVRTHDGNTLRYAMDAIDRMTKEPLAAGRPAGAVAPARKEPVLAFALSLLVPGLGQGYNGEWGKGGIMFGSAVVGFYLWEYSDDSCSNNGYIIYCTRSSTATIGELAYIGSVLWSIIDAPISASRINKRAGLAFSPALVPIRSVGAKPALGIQLGRIVF